MDARDWSARTFWTIALIGLVILLCIHVALPDSGVPRVARWIGIASFLILLGRYQGLRYRDVTLLVAVMFIGLALVALTLDGVARFVAIWPVAFVPLIILLRPALLRRWLDLVGRGYYRYPPPD